MERCPSFDKKTVQAYNPYLNKLEPITRTLCLGTKECEECSCDGDETKCDFYDYVRERGFAKIQSHITANQKKKKESEFYFDHHSSVVKPIADVYNNVFFANDAIFDIDNINDNVNNIDDDRQINDNKHFVLYRVFYDGDEKNNGPPVYVGRTKQPLPDRIREHLFHSKFRKTFDVDRVSCVQFTQLDSEADMNLYEIYYILKDKPVLNKDDKTKDSLTQDYLPELEWKSAYLPLWNKWKDRVHDQQKEVSWNKNEIQRLKEERRRVRWDKTLEESYRDTLLDNFDRRIDELKKNIK